MTVLAEVHDPDGRRVELTAERWGHILDEHPEMSGHHDAVLATVTAPEHRGPDPRPQRMRYWRRGLGPSRWLLAVIDFGSDPARIVTAYGNRKDPPGWAS